MSTTLSDAEIRKSLGAFYTPPEMAKALVDWAVRSSDDRIFDPSFGGFVFLDAAAARLVQLGVDPSSASARILGAELDEAAYLTAAISDVPATLVNGDFFDMRPGEEIPLVEVVVGNPPYVRYQEFNRSAEAAHRIAAEAGVPLTRLASSWAPFLIHATSFVAPGGRLAQVLPAELIHAQYATGITRYLAKNFRRVAIVVFDQRVFPGALEEVVLLFAEGREDEADGSIDLLSFKSMAELDTTSIFSDLQQSENANSSEKLLARLLPSATRELLADLAGRPQVHELADVARVEIGAVTGANSFFLMTEQEARGLPSKNARPAVSKAAQISGAKFTGKDHERLLGDNRKALMLVVDGNEAPKNPALRRRIALGEEAGVSGSYKCRIRPNWWSVPIPKRGVPDLLLTYFASEHPRLVLNEAAVLQTNTIHGVYISEGVDPGSIAAGFFNSLTLLSAELVGRSYGGGVLKLEPTEASSLLLPPITQEIGEKLGEVDRLIRDRDLQAVLDLIDPIVLGDGLGLSGEEISLLRTGGARLRARRRARSTRLQT